MAEGTYMAFCISFSDPAEQDYSWLQKSLLSAPLGGSRLNSEPQSGWKQIRAQYEQTAVWRLVTRAVTHCMELRKN